MVAAGFSGWKLQALYPNIFHHMPSLTPSIYMVSWFQYVSVIQIYGHIISDLTDILCWLLQNAYPLVI